MKVSTAKGKAIEQAKPAYLRCLESGLQTGEVQIVCGVIVEAGDPTNGLNRQFNCDKIHALALEIQRERGCRQ